jgi:hypothetical protein
MYPVAFEADYVERRSRLTTFFRLVLLIPWAIVSLFWGLAAGFSAVLAWFAMVITGRYPQGLYDLVAKALRFTTGFYGFSYLMTDRYPSFGGEAASGYPVRLRIAPPLERYSRWKALLRLILAIPVMIVLYLMNLLVQVIAMLSWVVIVVTGRQPEGLFDVTKLALAYQMRGTAYLLLVTETYPPLSPDVGAAATPATPAAPPTA